MCKLVAELVGADKQVIGETFARLELQSGNPGIDLRLTSEIYSRVHMKMRELGLDPHDTTPHELYGALVSLAAQHDSFLAKRIGVEKPEDASEVMEAISRLINRARFPKQVWALKSTSAKQLLKKNPPKNLMKLLHYRSLDSLLKRESAAQLIALSRHCEPATWQKKLLEGYRTLNANDFELRDVEVACLTGKHWGGISEFFASKHNSIVHSPEAGVVILMPLSMSGRRGLTLTSMLLTLHYISEIRTFSTYGKFTHMRPDFGALIADHLSEKNQQIYLAGQAIHWRIIHRYYGARSRDKHPEVFEPHIQPEDLAYRKAEAVLYRLEPALHFWHDLDYVGLPQADGAPISFNLADVAMALINNIPYESRISYHLEDAVWNEVYARYVGQENFERQLLLQLDEHSLGSAVEVEDMEFAW